MNLDDEYSFFVSVVIVLANCFMRWIGFRFEAKRNVFRMIGSRMMWVIGWRAISDWKTISRRCQLLDSPTFQLGEGRPVPILNLIAHRQPDIMFLIYRNLVYQSFFFLFYISVFQSPMGQLFPIIVIKCCWFSWIFELRTISLFKDVAMLEIDDYSMQDSRSNARFRGKWCWALIDY